MWPRESSQREGHPDAAVSKHSATVPALCCTRKCECRERKIRGSGHYVLHPFSRLPSDYATRLRGFADVHRWTGIELGAIHCAHPAGLPYVTLPLHRGLFTAHPATAPATLSPCLGEAEVVLSLSKDSGDEKLDYE